MMEPRTTESCLYETKEGRDTEGVGMTEELRRGRIGVTGEDQGIGESTTRADQELGGTGMRDCHKETLIVAIRISIKTVKHSSKHHMMIAVKMDIKIGDPGMSKRDRAGASIVRLRNNQGSPKIDVIDQKHQDTKTITTETSVPKTKASIPTRPIAGTSHTRTMVILVPALP